MTTCWPGLHQWAKWESFERGQIVRRPTSDTAKILGHDDPIVVGTYEFQKRICEKCGKSQLREVSA